MENEILYVVKANYEHDYVLRIGFNNGVEKMYDFSRDYNDGICQKLKDLDYFKNFTLDPFSIDWNNEIGFAPEYLYENGISIA